MSHAFMMKLKPASDYFGISYDRLRKMCLAGEIAHIRTGRDWMINVRSLEDYLNTAGLKNNKEVNE